MKAENLAKLIIEKCTTKEGEIKKKYLEMLLHLYGLIRVEVIEIPIRMIWSY